MERKRGRDWARLRELVEKERRGGERSNREREERERGERSTGISWLNQNTPGCRCTEM